MAEQAADREAARADRLDHWRHWLDFAWARGEIDGDFDDQAQAAPPAPDREGVSECAPVQLALESCNCSTTH
jgi:hypothetical protein